MFEKIPFKHVMRLASKGFKPASYGEDNGVYPFFSSGQKIKSCNSFDHDGEFIVIGDGGTFNSRYINGKFSASDHTLLYAPLHKALARFISYYLEANKDELDLITFKGMGMRNINRVALNRIEIPLPDLSTQLRICSFLNDETAKIDNLIEELKKLRINLQLKKRSLVSECLFKGVTSARSGYYKNSGVEWIGEIPIEWEVSKVKYVASINDEILTESTTPNYTFRYIEIGGVTYGEEGYKTEEVLFKDAPSRARRIVRNGDVLVSTVRTYLKAITGIGEDDANLVASTGFAVIRSNKNVIPDYLKYYFLSDQTTNKIMSISTGTSYPSVNTSQIGNLEICIPSLVEQRRIVNYLDAKTTKSDILICEIGNQINLLKTYRKSLINEAVSGKVEI